MVFGAPHRGNFMCLEQDCPVGCHGPLEQMRSFQCVLELLVHYATCHPRQCNCPEDLLCVPRTHISHPGVNCPCPRNIQLQSWAFGVASLKPGTGVVFTGPSGYEGFLNLSETKLAEIETANAQQLPNGIPCIPSGHYDIAFPKRVEDLPSWLDYIDSCKVGKAIHSAQPLSGGFLQATEEHYGPSGILLSV